MGKDLLGFDNTPMRPGDDWKALGAVAAVALLMAALCVVKACAS